MKLFINILMLNFCFISVNAQNLPKIQQGSQVAPQNIKIDGQNNEWPKDYKAFNPTNRLSYTIANDQKNLYVVVKMQDVHSAAKALNGAFQFTVLAPKASGVKSQILSVAYPHLKNRNDVAAMAGMDAEVIKKSKLDVERRIDSLNTVANKVIANSFKELEILDEKGVIKKVLSMYNQEGIRVAGRYDKEMYYVVELAIPIALLGQEIQKLKKFDYRIGLIGTLDQRNGKGPLATFNMSSLNPDMLFGLHTTFLEGEYSL